MPVVIAMLRGVNVGGHNQIKMDALRALCESLKLRNACSHIQSGNVIFKTASDAGAAGKRLETGIERSFGFRPAVIVRTVAEMKTAISKNPFAGRDDVDPRKLLVYFLAANPGAEAREKVARIKADPEELRLGARELYIYFTNGLARPKLSMPAVERALQTPATGRNWNVVTKLLEIAETLEASS
ncbi:MAG TPA: DUF1697 domain-containing protein [Candidatus Binataceae bacterium]